MELIKHWEMKEFDIIKNFHIKSGYGVLMMVCEEEAQYKGLDAEYKVVYNNGDILYLKVDRVWVDEKDGFYENVIYYWSGYQWEWFDWLTYNLNR